MIENITELLPCPFCGGKGGVREVYWGKYAIYCDACGATKSDFDGSLVYAESSEIAEQKLAAPWNHRSDPKPAQVNSDNASSYEFDRYINGKLMAEGVTVERATTLEAAIRAATRIAARGPNGEHPVLVMRRDPATATLNTEIERAKEQARRDLMDELSGTCVVSLESKFKVGDQVEKFTGDYRARGEVRGIFVMKKGALRYVVEHEVAGGGGSFCHIYSEGQLRLLERGASNAG